MELSDLIYEDEYICSTVLLSIQVTKITADHTQVDENTLFIALKGLDAECVFNQKPLAVVTDGKYTPFDIPYISVKNIRRQLALIYSRFYQID